MEKKTNYASKAKSLILLITSHWRRTYHFGGKLLEQLADQAASGLGERHHGIEELLEDLFQAGGCTLIHTKGVTLFRSGNTVSASVINSVHSNAIMTTVYNNKYHFPENLLDI